MAEQISKERYNYMTARVSQEMKYTILVNENTRKPESSIASANGTKDNREAQ